MKRTNRTDILVEIAKKQDSCIKDGINWLKAAQQKTVTEHEEAAMRYGFVLAVRLMQFHNWLKD